MIRSAAFISAVALGAGLLGCGATPEPRESSAPAPAHVENPQEEAALAMVTLTPSAERRLGIGTVPVEQRAIPRTRTLGGEVVVPTTEAAGTGPWAFALRPPLSAAGSLQTMEALVSADEQVNSARVRVDAAEVALARAERVLRGGAGSVRAVEEARTQVQLARATLDAAEARREVLAAANLRMPATVWIRVPVYVGDLDALDTARGARVGRLGGGAGGDARLATPVSAPPSANPDANTVDVFFVLENTGGALRPGQKVGVTLTLREDEGSRVVPWSAVVHDIHGGEWVYAQVAPRTFVRRRVQVRYVEGALAALASGPEPGVPVVTKGAAELLGTEFGVGH